MSSIARIYTTLGAVLGQLFLAAIYVARAVFRLVDEHVTVPKIIRQPAQTLHRQLNLHDAILGFQSRKCP